MTGKSPEQWLRQEVDDLLEVGSVGLYELVWLLNGAEFTLTDSGKKSIANRVANSIISDGQAKVYELAWPTNDVINGPVNLASRITISDAWPSEPSERYLALVP